MEQGSPQHLLQIVNKLHEGAQINTTGIKWLFADGHTELLISVEELAKRGGLQPPRPDRRYQPGQKLSSYFYCS
jgi:hypothetical protein